MSEHGFLCRDLNHLHQASSVRRKPDCQRAYNGAQCRCFAQMRGILVYEDPSASRLRPNRDEAGDRMYTITEDPGKRLLIMALSGRVDTDEALRALSQALTLSETDAISAVVCDVTAVQRGPASLIRIAAGLALGYRPGMRVALLSGDQQRATATRFARFSGLRDGVRVFASADDAQAWVGPAALPAALSQVSAGASPARGVRAPRGTKRNSHPDVAGTAA